MFFILVNFSRSIFKFFFSKVSVGWFTISDEWYMRSFLSLISCEIVEGSFIFGMSFSFSIFILVNLKMLFGSSLSMKSCSFILFWVFFMSLFFSFLIVYLLLSLICFSLFLLIFDSNMEKRLE